MRFEYAQEIISEIKAIAVISFAVLAVLFTGCTAESGTGENDVIQAEDGSSGALPQNIAGEREDRDFMNDLQQMYAPAEIDMTDRIDIGDAYTLITIDLKNSSNKFLLYRSQTGLYEELPVMDAVLKTVISENYFIFENRGEFTDSAFRSVPAIVRCFRVKGEEGFRTIYEKEVFGLTREIQTGHKNDELLSNIVITTDGIEAVFKPYDESENAAFYAGATDIPEANTYYIKDTREFVVEFSTTHISPDLLYDVEYATDENFYVSSFRLTEKNNKCAMIMTLRNETQNYTCETRRSPVGSDDEGRYPYFVLTFGGSDDLPLGY